MLALRTLYTIFAASNIWDCWKSPSNWRGIFTKVAISFGRKRGGFYRQRAKYNVIKQQTNENWVKLKSVVCVCLYENCKYYLMLLERETYQHSCSSSICNSVIVTYLKYSICRCGIHCNTHTDVQNSTRIMRIFEYTIKQTTKKIENVLSRLIIQI